MATRERKLKSAKIDREEEEEDEKQAKPSKSPRLLCRGGSDNDDDEEANEDLSLKIVEKSMLRACTTNQGDAVLDGSKNSGGSAGSVGVIDVSSSFSAEVEVVTDLKDEKKKKKQKKKKDKKIESPEATVDVVNEEEKGETDKDVEIDKLVETNPVEISDNIVLRKLLRGPRYFDPPDSGWGTCYNCGEEGHTTVNCTSVKRKKPCFVCGSLEHNAKQCTKGQDCFICKKAGHRAKDCSEKYKGESWNSKICLKCGNSGHDMFSCKNDYHADDLKEIQCYICKSFGHLCCADFTDTGPREVSCYRCGQLGHTGLECTRSRGETTGAGLPSACYKCGEEGHFARECVSSAKILRGETTGRGLPSSCYKCGEGGHFARECVSSAKVPRGETTGMGLPSSCYKCGEGGHFARECAGSAKVRKRNRELSTPTRRFDRDSVGVRSVPRDLGKANKNKKTHYEEAGFSMPSKSRQRGGWITEDPGDTSRRKAKVSGWRSPATPTNKRNKISPLSTGGHASSSRSFHRTRKLHFGTPASNGSAEVYQHRFSASRFGNYSNDGMRRNYDW
ncbi:hypothetical protein F0562_022411 [Nyssa sinensis]|uniref:CCHC-type domain-containing protein n=1 Tax=Nyssa sinensis TaxID=561372 RepID=A0A5J5BNK1_9ASTE|nr:hypothetical protein F0562_022411 [Nyssa sinensis]